MKTAAQVEALRSAHETAVWNAIQNPTLNPTRANPPPGVGGQVAAAMIEERSRAFAFANNPSPATEAAFDIAHGRTASLLAQWQGSGAANSLTTGGASTSSGARVAGISVPVLIVGGLGLWWWMKRRKKGGGKKKLFGIF